MSEADINNRINEIFSSGLINYSKLDASKIIYNCIDLTTLEGADTNEKVLNLCQKARTFNNKGRDIPNVAAVCIYPPFIRIVKKNLDGSNIKTASVAGAFPSGQSPLYVKLEEVKYAVNEGADEIDMVISRGKFMEGEYNLVFDEIASIKEICKEVHLKVILETGELGTISNIRKASEIAINAGADFIKTSTGKISPAATEQTVLVMLDTIKEFFEKTGKQIGIKPAGGISEPSQALAYFNLINHTLGKQWITNEYFRIGASRLADKILSEIKK